MADISKIKIGTITYNIKDATARDDYVPKTTTIASIDLQDNIGTNELQNAIGLEDLAYSNSASGSYTPAGTIGEIDVSPTGSIDIELANATVSEITSVGTLPTYTAGSLTGGKAAVIDTTKFNGGSIATWTDYSYTAPSFTYGAFTPAYYDAGFLSTGTVASFTQGSKASLTDQTKSKFANKVLKAQTASNDDSCLEFVYVDSTVESSAFGDAVTDRGEFTANGTDSFTANTLQTLDSTKFHGGTKAADTFTAGTLSWGTFDGGSIATINSGFYTAGTDVSYVAPSYIAGTLPTMANKTITVTGATFTGTTKKVTPIFTGTTATIVVTPNNSSD